MLSPRLQLAAPAGLLVGLFFHATAAHNPDERWNIVHRVDLSKGVAGGFAVLKDSSGAKQFLLLPTKKIGGIESRSVRARGAANYFAEAWKAGELTEVHRPVIFER
jgi:CDP-diacylglycerol pyrophosphatase